jgi:hypothetical protein
VIFLVIFFFDIMTDPLTSARDAVVSIKLQLAEAERNLVKEEENLTRLSVRDFLNQSVRYDTHISKGVHVSGPGFESFVVKGRAYPLGIAKLPMSIVERARILNLSELFRHLFRDKVSDNILVQMNAFLTADKWQDLQTVDLFVTPINIVKRENGQRRGLDMPNVVFAFAYLVTQRMDCVILDPNYTGRDTHVNIINVSRTMREMFDMKLRVNTAIQPMMHTDDAFSYVFYMRAGGIPDSTTTDLIYQATGTRNLMSVQVAPGKYDTKGSGNPNWSAIIRNDFPDSCAMILHIFSMIDQFAQSKKKRTICRIFFVLDSFSAYALYLAIAIKAYGLEQCAVFLTYFQGKYSQMSLTNLS